MSVYKKLSDARIKLQQVKIKKSGHNKFAGYYYMQLEDFLPPIQEIFHELNLCGIVSFSEIEATLTIVDVENPMDRIVIHSPMSEAALKGCHAVQNLGAVQTYLRRYLWVSALEIVEHDAIDSSEPASEQTAKPIHKPKPVTPPPLSGKGSDVSWNITIDPEANWKDSAVLGITKALDFAESTADVESIWKVNRPIFDRMKEDDKVTYDDLLAILGTYKKKFQ